MPGPFSSKSRSIAVAGVLAAGSLAILWLACVVPSGRLGVTAAAGLFPVAGVLAAGRMAGYLCWAAGGKFYKLLKTRNMRCRGIPVYTNTPVASAMRGFGSPQQFFPVSSIYSSVAFAMYITVNIQKINACITPENQSK